MQVYPQPPVSSTLTALQRLPAEELSKTKWIKTAGKIPNAILKELLVRYDAWSEGGGTRTSLADPLGWEDEENQCVCLDPLSQGSNLIARQVRPPFIVTVGWVAV